MAQNKKQKPRYNPEREKNPTYKKWGEATRAGVGLGFSVPQDVIPVQFDWKEVIPYENVGPYSTDNYLLGANYVPKIMERWPEMNFNDAVGLSANWIYESGGNPEAREGIIPQKPQPVNPKKMTGPGGFGLLQLTGPRKKAFWKFVNNDPKRAADPMEQMAYMKAESEGKIDGLKNEANMYAKARGSKNPAQGAYNAVKFIERPLTSESWPERMALADSIASNALRMKRKPKTLPQAEPASVMSRLGSFRDNLWNSVTSIFD